MEELIWRDGALHVRNRQSVSEEIRVSKCFAEEAGGNAGIEQKGVAKKQQCPVIAFCDAVELLYSRRSYSVEYLIFGEHFVPLSRPAPRFFCSAVNLLPSR